MVNSRAPRVKKVLAVSGLFLLLSSTGQDALINLADISESKFFDSGKIVKHIKASFTIPTAFAGSGGGSGGGGSGGSGGGSGGSSSGSGGGSSSSSSSSESSNSSSGSSSNAGSGGSSSSESNESSNETNNTATNCVSGASGTTDCSANDTTHPNITITYPHDGEVFANSVTDITVKATVTDDTDQSPSVTGTGKFTLKDGVNTISVKATDASGNVWTETVTVKRQSATNETSTTTNTTAWTDGTYKGTGYYEYGSSSAAVVIKVTITNGKIEKISFLNFPTSDAVTAGDFDATLTKIINTQNPTVDTVSGATGTSQAVQDALSSALSKAEGTTNKTATKTNTKNTNSYTNKSIPATTNGNTDSDGDGISDLAELAIGTDPYSADSDNDGNPDKAEIMSLYDPLSGGGALLFADLMPSHWAGYFIAQLYLDDVIKGYSDKTFRPEKRVNRAEGTKMIVEASDLSVETGAVYNFSDISTNDWFYAYVQTAVKNSIISQAGKFNAAEELTRAATIKMVIESLGNVSLGDKYAANPSFTDVDKLDWFSAYAEFAKLNGIISGYADGSFGGSKPVTRAQLAKIVYQVRQLQSRTNLTYPETLSETKVATLRAERATAKTRRTIAKTTTANKSSTGTAKTKTTGRTSSNKSAKSTSQTNTASETARREAAAAQATAKVAAAKRATEIAAARAAAEAAARAAQNAAAKAAAEAAARAKATSSTTTNTTTSAS